MKVGFSSYSKGVLSQQVIHKRRSKRRLPGKNKPWIKLRSKSAKFQSDKRPLFTDYGHLLRSLCSNCLLLFRAITRLLATISFQRLGKSFKVLLRIPCVAVALTLGLIYCIKTLLSRTGNNLSKQFKEFKAPSGELVILDARVQAFRFLVAGGILLGGSIILAGRLYQLQYLQYDRWQQLAFKQHRTSRRIEGARGSIYDREGRPLAVSVETVSVALQPRKFRSNPALEASLADYMNLPKEFIAKKVHSRKPFVWLAKGLSRKVGDALRDMNLKGLIIDRMFHRVYPQGELAATLLGRVSDNGIGQSGVELGLENDLHAPESFVKLARDGKMGFSASLFEKTESAPLLQNISQLMESAIKPSTPVVPGLRRTGNEVVLTIDSALQQIVEEEIYKALEKADASKVMGVVLDADSGEILVSAQTSKFNPNLQKIASPDDFRNIVVQNSFEPGSTLKPLVAALALDKGLVGINDIMNCENGRYKVGRHIIRDVHPSGMLSVAEVLVRSSNVCMAKIGQRLGVESLYSGLRNLGFGQKTGVSIAGEARGILRDESQWKDIDLATISFGQGIAVTAMQLIRGYAALANGGRLIQPTIIRRKGFRELPSVRVFRAKTVKEITSALIGVTESKHGTGRNAAFDGVHIAGKTGTAQKARINGRGYDSDRVLSSFIGYIDGSNLGVPRRLVMLVVVDEPKVKPRWGGVVAAPVFKASMERIFTRLMAGKERFQAYNSPISKSVSKG